MSEIKTTEANDALKKQDEKDEELKPEELNQVSGGIFAPEGAQQNHNQTCTFIG
jgi:hypothetical protein